MLIAFTTPTMAKTVSGIENLERPMERQPSKSPTDDSCTPAPKIINPDATIWIFRNFTRGEISATSSHMPTAMTMESAKEVASARRDADERRGAQQRDEDSEATDQRDRMAVCLAAAGVIDEAQNDCRAQQTTLRRPPRRKRWR